MVVFVISWPSPSGTPKSSLASARNLTQRILLNYYRKFSAQRNQKSCPAEPSIVVRPCTEMTKIRLKHSAREPLFYHGMAILFFFLERER